jgi:succinyl-CoA synthetase alpha subunit
MVIINQPGPPTEEAAKPYIEKATKPAMPYNSSFTEAPVEEAQSDVQEDDGDDGEGGEEDS